MPRQDTTDFLTAFAVGTVLGIGATLLLRPERSPRERIVRQLKPYGGRLRKNAGSVRRAMRDSAEATGDLTGDVITVGKELLGEFRSEVSRILSDAREELGELAEERARDVRKSARRAGRKLGM